MSNSNQEWGQQLLRSGAKLILPQGVVDTSTLSGRIIDVLRRGSKDKPAYTWWARELGRLAGQAKQFEQMAANAGLIAFAAGFVIGIIAGVLYG